MSTGPQVERERERKREKETGGERERGRKRERKSSDVSVSFWEWVRHVRVRGMCSFLHKPFFSNFGRLGGFALVHSGFVRYA